MPRWLAVLYIASTLTLPAFVGSVAYAQFGGGGAGAGGGAGGPGGGAGGPAGPAEKPAFRDVVNEKGGMKPRRESGDQVVTDVTVAGNKNISTERIFQQLQTRKDRFYDYETVLADIRRLNDMGAFEHVTYRLKETPEGMAIRFEVRERPTISKVVFHGNRALNERELTGRAGINAGDPMSEFSIESARRRLVDYYQEEGFNQVSIKTIRGFESDPQIVIFRINEGPKERIAAVRVEGGTIVTQARLEKIVKSRGPFGGMFHYIGNTADLNKIDQDVKVLESYYHNLGFLTATVGRRIEYDSTGKWMTVIFVVNEGERFKVNEVKIVGNQYIETASLVNLLELKSGDMFNGTLMRRDIGEITYAYGSLGFIYSEIEPQTVMRDEANLVDLVYTINEGDRWKIRNINVNIDGEPHLMKDTTLLNQIDLVEGEYINRRTLELNRRRIERQSLLETNPAVADPPDIKVVPVDEDDSY
jgi:outer membrane protein insertion porin family